MSDLFELLVDLFRFLFPPLPHGELHIRFCNEYCFLGPEDRDLENVTVDDRFDNRVIPRVRSGALDLRE